MKYRRWLLLALVTFPVGILAAAAWSAHLGRQRWSRRTSPLIFAWRNFRWRRPKIENQLDSPLLITNPRYYSFMSIGSGIGGELRFDIVNRSEKLVHSYACRHYSPDTGGNGAYGSHPEGGLPPGQLREDSIATHFYHDRTLTIDFTQFADGATWLSNAPEATVKPKGLSVGAKAAATYLLKVLEQDGLQTVIEALPRIHADVIGPFGRAADPDLGVFGFYSGVTNIVVRVQDANKEGGRERVEAVLRSFTGS